MSIQNLTTCLLERFIFVHIYHIRVQHLQCDGKVVLAMDGLFGLPRKKSAGVSHRDAVHGNLFFYDQALVDDCVNNAGNTNSKSNNILFTSKFTCISRTVMIS